MATLALSRDLLSEFASLESDTRNRVSKLAGMFQSMSVDDLRTSKGIHLERHTNQRDSRARTIRVDRNHRGVVLDVGDDETFVLCHVDTHDKVDRWMARNEFRVNEATGALEVVDVGAIADVAQSATGELPTAAEAPAIYDHRSDKEFRQLGVDLELLPALRVFTDEDQLEAVLHVVPPRQADALMLLLGDESVQVLYGQVAGSQPEPVDTDDLAAAVSAPASQGQFHVLSTDDELQEMLAQPLAQWRVFLHPSQERLAGRPSFSGPVRVTGGAGTGKTVVAMHRAVHLAERASTGPARPVLFTTYTRNLAEHIERDLRRLAGPDVLDRIEVLNVDRLAHRIVAGEHDAAPAVVDGDDLRRLWQDAADVAGADDLSPDFLAAEFDHVVLAQGLRTRSDYFQASRTGRGVPLDRRRRARVWKAVEHVLAELTAKDARTWLQLADEAGRYLDGRATRPYEHVVVDEGQDLHETQWRLLRAAVGEHADDLFIVGDAHQRIYDRRASLLQVGIDIRGRGHRLRLNYRTTHEILRWAMRLLGEEPVDDLADGLEVQSSATYHSFLHGAEPVVEGFDARQQQLEALVSQIEAWRGDGATNEEIVVTARVASRLGPVEQALQTAGLDVHHVTNSGGEAPGVRLATMHRLKGLEFRFVAIVDADEDHLPLRFALTSARADQVQHDIDVRRDRCLAYVAATRARDGLWVGWAGRPSPFLPT